MDMLAPDVLARDLSVADLTDPAVGPNAMQTLVDDAASALTAAWRCRSRVVRSHPIVPVEDCYDRLGFPPAAVTRDRRYTRYVSETCMLRSHTSAMVPPQLRRLATAGYVADTLLVLPGVVYRRDAIDRLHTGTPHQLDLWRITANRRCGPKDLDAMVSVVVAALLPDLVYRTTQTSHPYTRHGLQIDVRADGEWVEVGECGVAAPAMLAASGLDTDRVTGLAMGLGLDRILMLRKGIADIRLLRSPDPRVRAQLLDLDPYRPVSDQPAVERHLSVAVDAGETEETLGDQVRDALGPHSRSVEVVSIVSETAAAALPAAVVERLGLQPGQKNVLLRVVLRDLDRTLTSSEANGLRDAIYGAVHAGTNGEWVTDVGSDSISTDRPSSAMMTTSASGPRGGQR